MNLPNGWKEVGLGDVAKVTSGGTPLRSVAEYWNGNVPWVKTAQIQNSHIALSQVDEYITELGVSESSAKIIPAGTLLMAMYGQGKTRGQVAILDFPAAINQACAAFNLDKTQVVRDYLYQYFLFSYEDLRAVSNSGGQQNLSADLIKKFPVILPPLAEQKKIAETLSVWDSAIEKMEKLIDEKENLFKVELKAKIIVRGFEENWEKFTVKDCVVALTPPSRISQDNYKKTGNFPVIDQSKEPIAGWTNDENCIIRSSNPLIIFGDHTCILKIMKIPFAQGADGIKVLSANDRFDAPFLYYSLKADPVVPEGYKRHYSSLQRKEVFCPSKDIQKKIARYFEIKDKELSLLKQQLALYKKQKQGLMQKLLVGEWRVK